MMHAVLYAPAFVGAMPTQDIFETTNSLFNDFIKLAGLGAMAGVAWYLLKEIFKIKTFAAGAIAVAAAIFLSWGVSQAQNSDIQKTLDETISNSTGVADQAPAKKG